jgi:hypothetical protein
MLQQDKILHIILGLIWCGCALLAHVAFLLGGLGASLAASTTAYALMYEASQWYRREGQPDPWDAVATAAPGFAAWAALELLARTPGSTA